MAVVASPTVATGFVGSNADVDCFRLLRSTRVAVFVMVAENNVKAMIDYGVMPADQSGSFYSNESNKR